MRRVTALTLFTFGYALLALLSPLAAFVPAFASFFVAGLVLSR
jgi:hypothetical protein